MSHLVIERENRMNSLLAITQMRPFGHCLVSVNREQYNERRGICL